MKNIDKWVESKWIKKDKVWAPNPESISPKSMVIANLQIKLYQQTIKKFAHGKLLDCGAGQAPFYGMYKDLVKEVQCVDWEESPHQISYCDKTADLNKSIPYKDKEFDTVLLADVLEHIYKPNVLISEISRVLKKEGNLILFVPYLYWLHEEPNDHHRYTKHALTKYCQENSLEVEFLKPYGGGPDALRDLGSKVLQNSPVLKFFFSLYWKIVMLLPVYNKIRNKTINKMPLGYVLVAKKV